VTAGSTLLRIFSRIWVNALKGRRLTAIPIITATTNRVTVGGLLRFNNNKIGAGIGNQQTKYRRTEMEFDYVDKEYRPKEEEQ